MASEIYGAIEAGGTKFICEVLDANGSIRAATRIDTARPEGTLWEVLRFFSDHAGGGRYRGFGIAAFGPLDLHEASPTYGHILATPKPHWSGVDLAGPFKREFGCPVLVDTDVNAAALAEALLGTARPCDLLVYVTVGTGIGGGVFHRGQTLLGALHPEMGHIRVLRHPRDEFMGNCPFHGDCLEGLASGSAISARYGTSLDRLPAGHQAFEIVSYYLGQLAASAILMLSPQCIVFGGGVMREQALFDGIRASCRRLINGYAGVGGQAAFLDELIRPPRLEQRSGISGAFLLAKRAGGSP